MNKLWNTLQRRCTKDRVMFRVYSIPSYKTRGLAVGALLPSIIHVSQVTRKHRRVAAAEEPPLRDTWADWLLKLYKLIWSRVSGPLFDSTKSPQIAENAPPPPPNNQRRTRANWNLLRMNYLQLCLTEVFVKVLIKRSERDRPLASAVLFLKRCFKQKCYEFHEIGKRKYLVQRLNKVGIFQVTVDFFSIWRLRLLIVSNCVSFGSQRGDRSQRFHRGESCTNIPAIFLLPTLMNTDWHPHWGIRRRKYWWSPTTRNYPITKRKFWF